MRRAGSSSDLLAKKRRIVVLAIEEETPPRTKHRAPHSFSTEDTSALLVAEGGIKLGMGISSSG